MASDAATAPARHCAVLGDPIDHSLSPVLHRAAYDALGLTGWTYTAERVGTDQLAPFLSGLDDRWRGLSLTMPLKRAVWGLAASASPRARMVGAVNTLVRTSYGWAGDNTDLPGAVAAVRERTPAPIRSVAILGAGATAASTGLAMAELGAREVTLLARDAGRAAETVAVIGGHPSAPAVRVQPLEDLVLADALVSTVPASAQTHALVDRWRHVPVCFDVIYDPWPTPLTAAATGIVVTGLDLLVHQAAVQVELFASQPAPLEAIRAAAQGAIGAEPAAS